MPAKKTARKRTTSKSPAKPAQSGPGAPTKLTTEVRESIERALKAGAYVETAASYAGVHKDTFYEWLKRGAQDRKDGKSSIYAEFSDTIEKALASWEVTALAIIERAGLNAWQAAAWKLERKFPERWGRREAQQHSGEVTIKVVRKDLTRTVLDDEMRDGNAED